MALTNDKIAAVQKPTRGRPEMSADQRAQMKAQISNIAETLFTRDGYAKVSMRRIAKEIGCTPMALYGYYDSKLDILQSLWGGVFEQLFTELAAMAVTDDAAADLRALLSAYVRFWLDRPDYYRLVFMAEGVTQPDVSLFLDRPDIIAKYSLFQKTISRLCPSAEAGEVKLKLDFLLSVLHGIAHNHVTISGYDWSAPEDQVELLVKAMG